MQSIRSYLLFTTPFCKFCPTIKEFMATVALPGKQLDASKDEGSEKAINLKVQKVPTVVFLDDAGNEISRAHNVSEIRDILSDS